MLKAAVANEKINLGHDLTPDEELAVLSRELKQRKDSIKEYEEAGRDDTVAQLKQEIKIVQGYMPEQLSTDEVRALVSQTITEVGATSKADFGKVMKAVMPKLKGQADGKLVNQLVNEQLNK